MFILLFIYIELLISDLSAAISTLIRHSRPHINIIIIIIVISLSNCSIVPMSLQYPQPTLYNHLPQLKT